MTLSPLQVNLIKGDLRQNGIELAELQDDLLDHICCLLEQANDKNRSFEEVYEETRNAFFPDGFRSIQDQTTELLSEKHDTLRKAMNIIGVTASSLLMIGSIAKVISVTGANEMILLGTAGLVFGYLPMLLFISLLHTDFALTKFRNYVGFFGAEAFILGIFLQILHRPLGKELMIVGFALILVVFIPLLVKSEGGLSLDKLKPATASVILLAVASTFFAFSNKKASYDHKEQLLSIHSELEQSVEDKLERQKELSTVGESQDVSEMIQYIDLLKAYILTQVKLQGGTTKLTIDDVMNNDAIITDIMLHNKLNHPYNGTELTTKLSELNTHANRLRVPIELLSNLSKFEKLNLLKTLCSLTQLQLELAIIETETFNQ